MTTVTTTKGDGITQSVNIQILKGDVSQKLAAKLVLYRSWEWSISIIIRSADLTDAGVQRLCNAGGARIVRLDLNTSLPHVTDTSLKAIDAMQGIRLVLPVQSKFTWQRVVALKDKIDNFRDLPKPKKYMMSSAE